LATMEMSDPKARASSEMNYLQNKTRLGELDLLARELDRELEAKQGESAEAMIEGVPFELAQISSVEAQLRQVRQAIEILERRIASFRRGEFR